MSIPNSKRGYGLSDAALKQLIDKVLLAARRDITQLAAYGETSTKLDAIEAANTAFAMCPPDEYWAGAMINATFNKNEKRTQVLQQTRQICERARIHFGDDNGILVQFATATLSRQKDEELVRTGRTVVRSATEHLAELAAVGLTAPMIAAYETMVEEFDTLIDVQIDKIMKRDKAVEERIALGNVVYNMIVKLAAKGKLCWQDTSEAYYNDYVLHPSSHKQISIIEGTVASGTVVNTSVNDATAATVITMRNEGNVPIIFFYALNPTDITGPMPRIVQPNEEVVETAANLGFSEQLRRFNVYNNSPEDCGYRVEW